MELNRKFSEEMHIAKKYFKLKTLNNNVSGHHIKPIHIFLVSQMKQVKIS